VIALPAPGRTLEDLTADVLRPLLKTWLDENLPDIVRDRVDEEVRRIARNRVR
jgi:cell pole-organizing protein PopZ